MTRETLKRACLAALDKVAIEHGVGHQGKLAARYVLRGQDGTAIELMFEKGPNRPANLWMTQRAGQALVDQGIRTRYSAAAATNATLDANGKPRYGRHSALKPMRQLAHADLLCFTIEREMELLRILDHLTGQGASQPA